MSKKRSSALTARLHTLDSHPLWGRLVRNASWSLGAAVFSRAASLLGVVIITHNLSPQQFGTLAIVQLFMAVAAGLAGLGLRVAVTKRVAETRTSQPRRAEGYVAQTLRLSLLASLSLSAGFLIARNWIAAGIVHRPEDISVVVVLAGMLPFTVVGDSLIGILAGLEEFRRAARLQVARTIASTVASVVGVVLGGLLGAIVGWTVADIASCVLGLAITNRALNRVSLRLHFRGPSPDWNMVFRIGLPAAAASLAVQGSLLYGQQLLAATPGGLAEVAAFSVAFRWSASILFVLTAVSPVFLPMLANLRAEGKRSDYRTLLRSNVAATLGLSAGPALLVGLASPWLMGLSGAGYRQQSLILVILAVAAVPTGFNTLLSQAALSLDAIGAWLLSDLVLAGTLVSCALLLVGRWKADGLAFAYLLAYIATCLVLWPPVRHRLAQMGPRVRPVPGSPL